MSNENIKKFAEDFVNKEYFSAREQLKEVLAQKVASRKEKIGKSVKI